MIAAPTAIAALGDFDPAFGFQGVSYVRLGKTVQTPNAITLKPDGKYLVAFSAQGLAGYGGGIARFNSDHSVDIGWGRGGVIATQDRGVLPNRGASLPLGLAYSGDSVFAVEKGGNYAFSNLSKYQVNGDYAADFGTSNLGQALFLYRDYTQSVPDQYNVFTAVLPLSNGKLLALGEVNPDLFIARFTATGEADATTQLPSGFNRLVLGAGIAKLSQAVLTGDEKVLIVGSFGTPSRGYVARMNIDGQLDSTFGSGGLVNLSNANGATACRAISLATPRIIVGCTETSNGASAFRIYALTESGVIDGAFDSSPKSSGGAGDELFALVTLPDGRIFAAGRAGATGGRAAVLGLDSTGGALSGFATAGWYFAPEAAAMDFRVMASNGTELIVAGTWADPDGSEISTIALSFTGVRTHFAHTEFSYSDGYFRKLRALSGGAMLAAGNTAIGNRNQFATAKLLANGQLDSTFGIDGRAQVSTVDYLSYGLQDLAIDAAGSILMTGDFGRNDPNAQVVGVARLLANGAIDSTFNTAGTPGQNYLVIPGAARLDELVSNFQPGLGRSIATQSNGKILVASHFLSADLVRQSIAVRFNTDGTVDTSYGTGGVAKTNFAGASQSRAILLDAQDRAILLGVGSVTGSTQFGLQLARFDVNGNLDAGFGVGGMTGVPRPTGYSLSSNGGKKLLRLADGRLLAIFEATFQNQLRIGVARFDANGELDRTFGSGGMAMLSNGILAATSSYVNDAVVLRNGRIALVGVATDTTKYLNATKAILIRLLPNGLVDSSFAQNGIREYPEFAVLSGLEALGDGSLLLAGNQAFFGLLYGAVAKTLPDPPAAPQLVAVKSVKTHGASGKQHMTIAHDIPVTGTVSVEPRTAELNGTHTLIFQFDGNVPAGIVAAASDQSGTAVGSATVITAGADATVSLNGIPDGSRINLVLKDASANELAAASIGFLVGNNSQSRMVDGVDLNAIRAAAGRAVDNTNFLLDVNLSGFINATDLVTTKVRNGRSLP